MPKQKSGKQEENNAFSDRVARSPRSASGETIRRLRKSSFVANSSCIESEEGSKPPSRPAPVPKVRGRT